MTTYAKDWMKVEGLNAFVTGATSGIGKAICDSLAKHKVNVFAVGRNQEVDQSIVVSDRLSYL